MTAYIIMHNMIVEDGCNEDEDFRCDSVGQLVNLSPREVCNGTCEFHEFMRAHHEIRNVQTHSQLRDDLIEHLWSRHGNMY
jgi:hypothetical protein